ncbi:MAG: Asp/Glu racemase [Devosia sp.]|nr:Asp/Glu racemase [Devosia sp.]
MRIACLHTAASNVAVLEAAAAAIGGADLVLHHAIRDDLLRDVEAAGGLNADVSARGRAIIERLLAENDAVLVTCSSIGALADGRRVIRIDQALAEEAVLRGRAVVALCASPTTVGPTTALFSSVASGTGVAIDVELIEGAWALFRSGETGGYFQAIASAAAAALAKGADMVALAQVSMSGAVDLLPQGQDRVLAPPQVALRTMLRANQTQG